MDINSKIRFAIKINLLQSCDKYKLSFIDGFTSRLIYEDIFEQGKRQCRVDLSKVFMKIKENNTDQYLSDLVFAYK